MKNRFILLSFSLLIFAGTIWGQGERVKIEGKVTYFTSQNIYAEFSSTAGISVGDTVYSVQDGILTPYILIRFISSRSVAGEYQGKEKPVKGAVVFAFSRTADGLAQIQTVSDSSAVLGDSTIKPAFSAPQRHRPGATNKIDGKFSVQSSSDFNSGTLSSRNLQRWRYTFSFNMNDIANSGIDFQTYSNYSYTSNTFISSPDPFHKNLRVYSFNAKYSYEPGTTFRLGRFQSSELASLGPVDGLVADHKFSFARIGAIIGSHPDFSDYGYNLNYFQFGAFAARQDSLGDANTEQSIGFFQQMNNSEVDRRFLYYQNTSNIFRTVNLFFSTEFDLFKKEAGKVTSSPQLTGLFTSVRYSPWSYISVGVSYDARRNIIYYETYKSFLDSVITNELRQGVRLNIVVRPFKGVTVGLNNSYRKQKGDAKANNNFGGYIYLSQLPYIYVSPVFNYTRLSNSFTNGYSAGINLSRNLLDLFDLNAGYRILQYTFLRNNAELKQQTFTFDIYYSFVRNLSLGINFESSHENNLTQNRLFIDLTARL